MPVLREEHVEAGAHTRVVETDARVSECLALVGETRWTWAKSELGRDFEDFEPIDLSGLSLSLGLLVRF